MWSRKAGLPFATWSWKRELSIQETVTRIENDLDRKFSKSKFFYVFFSENHFFLRFLITCSLFLISRKYFFDFFPIKKTKIRPKFGAGTGYRGRIRIQPDIRSVPSLSSKFWPTLHCTYRGWLGPNSQQFFKVFWNYFCSRFRPIGIVQKAQLRYFSTLSHNYSHN